MIINLTLISDRASAKAPAAPASARPAVALACLSLLGAGAGVARAQEAPSAPPAAALSASSPAASSPGEVAPLKAVTVKGSRSTQDYRAPTTSLGVLGDQRPLDVPFSTHVLTRQLIDNQQAAGYGDYLKNDPSTTLGNVPVGFASLRGFAIGADGYLFDGLPGAVALSDGRYQLQGVERVEVLKGPAAFLYGLGMSTSVGGTLNFVPKKPGNEPVRTVTAGYTSSALWSTSADLGDRFGAERQFGYRLNVGLKEGEQAVRRADWKHRSATLAMDWRAAPGLTFSGGLESTYNRYPSLQPFFILAPGVAVPTAPRLGQSLAQSWDDFSTVGSTAYLRADWQAADEWTVTAQLLRGTATRPQTKEARFGQITGVDGATTLFASQDGSRQSATTAQAMLRGKLTTGPLAHQVSLSAAVTRNDASSGSTALVPGLLATNLYAPSDSPEPAAVAVAVLPRQRTRGTSLLLSDLVQLGPQWSVLAGVRHAKLTTDNFSATGTLSSEASKSSPFGALIWKPLDNASVYVNYAEALERGGAASSAPGSVARLPPIVTRQAEVGTKWELEGVTLTAAAFNLRRPLEIPVPGTTQIAQNGLQQHRGLELTASGQLTRELAVVAGAMGLDPRARNTGNPATEGKRPVGVPRATANVFLDQRLAAVPGLFVNGGVYHAGRQFVDAANTQVVAAWTRVDLGGRYETRLGSTPTTFYFGIENLTDRNYWAGAQSGLLTLAEPRTVKLSARFSL